MVQPLWENQQPSKGRKLRIFERQANASRVLGLAAASPPRAKRVNLNSFAISHSDHIPDTWACRDLMGSSWDSHPLPRSIRAWSGSCQGPLSRHVPSMETPTAEKWRGWGAIAVLLTELTALADQRIRTIERSDGMRRATAQVMRCGKARICSEVWLGHSHHRIELGQ